MPTGVANAATYTVTKTADTADGSCDGDCSLREAIIAANANPGPDIVTVPDGTYVLTLVGAGEDQAATGDLDILDDVMIMGAGADRTRIDGNMTDRVFDIFSPAAVRIDGLTMEKGSVLEDVGGAILVDGGAALTLTNCILTNNSGYGGGAITNYGTLTLAGSALSDNSAGGGGGAIVNGGTLTLAGSTLSNNSTSGLSGGGLDNGGTATLTHCTLTGNSVINVTSGLGFGGGINNADGATLTLDSSILSGNSASNTGGGIANDGMATLTTCALIGNTAAGGGGIANHGMLTLDGCTLSGNSATDVDGGGGALASVRANFNPVAPAVVMKNCTLAKNSAGGEGGALINTQTMLTLDNCTVSENSAGIGGGIFNSNVASTTTRLTNCTVSGNSADSGGGIFNSTDGNATLTNTIVANSPKGGNCGAGSVSSNGHNLDDDGSCNFDHAGDLSKIAARLAALNDNGGPTQTSALLPDSPAINAGDETVCGSSPVDGLDQRGYVRPGAGATNCSIGAYEYNSSGPPGGTATPTTTGMAVATASPTSGVAASVTPTATPTPIACVGDCDQKGTVTVDEILTLVSIALGNVDLSACDAGDSNGDKQITVDEILTAVSNALDGCPPTAGADRGRLSWSPFTFVCG